MSEVRIFAYRQKALAGPRQGSACGHPQETRRAWLIVERDWIRMAEREALNDAASWVDDAARLRLTTVAASR